MQKRLFRRSSIFENAEMSERPKEHDWKSCVRHKRTEGSNPSLCAKKAPFSGAFSCFLRFYAEFFVFALAKLCTRMQTQPYTAHYSIFRNLLLFRNSSRSELDTAS